MLKSWFFLILFFADSINVVLSLVTLYGSQGSRSPLVNWFCHEANIPLQMGDRSNNPHPFGQIPCLVGEEGTVVFESGAILSYLSDKYQPQVMDTPEKRAEVCKWLVWANASLDPVLFKENERGQVIGTGAGEENRKLRVLDTILSTRPFLLGKEFSVADVAVAAYLLYIPLFFGSRVNFKKLYPSIAAYMLKCASRPAYKKAYPTEADSIIQICSSY